MPDPRQPDITPSAVLPLRALADSRAGFAVVWACGELDTFTSPRLDQLLESLAGVGHKNLVIDLGDLRFIDSSGLDLLVRWSRRLRAGGGYVYLCRPPLALEIMAAVTREGADLDLEPVPLPDPPMADVIDMGARREAQAPMRRRSRREGPTASTP